MNNRIFLLSGIFLSALLPFVSWTKAVVVEASAAEMIQGSIENSSITAVEQHLNWWDALGYLYLFGMGVLLLKIAYQLVRIFKVTAGYESQTEENFKYIQTKANINPFSFFNLIIYNPDRHSEEELQIILEHEKVHGRDLHSVDLVLSAITCAVLWFNPFSWLYKRSVEQNLEFLADQKTLQVTGDKKQYQYALLHISAAKHFNGLTTHFHRSFVKNRILMLEKEGASGKAKWKYFMILPVLVFFLYSFNVQEEIQIVEKDRPNTPLNKVQEEPLFLIDQNTSTAGLNKIEDYFKENYSLQIAFTGVKRNENGLLSGFKLSTKFEGQENFETRLENFANDVLKPQFLLQFDPESSSLKIREIAGKAVEFKITQEAIHALRTDISYGDKTNN